jgi:hypothetical protein
VARFLVVLGTTDPVLFFAPLGLPGFFFGGTAAAGEPAEADAPEAGEAGDAPEVAAEGRAVAGG